MFLTDIDSLLKLFIEYWPKVEQKNIDLIFNNSGGIDPLDGFILHLLILKYKPSFVIEIGPNKGYSTICQAAAMRTIGHKRAFITCEVDRRVEDTLRANLAAPGLLGEYVSPLFGDAIEVIPDQLKFKSIQANFAFTFIDADHTEDFANKYIEKIFPYILSGSPVGIHDIRAEERSNSGCTNFNTSLLGGTHGSGEEKSIRAYLKRFRKEWFSTHAITGGKHEGANLPLNKKFYEDLKKITGRNFIRKDICPKLLLFEK